MITVTHIKIINGNNNPCLFDKDIKKTFETQEELEKWRHKLKQIAMKRFKKEQINIDLIYKSMLLQKNT